MQLLPVDGLGRLWQVQDLLPAEQLAEIQAVDWSSLQQEPANLALRRQIAWNDPVTQRIGSYINQLLPEINQQLGTRFAQSGGHFWIDQPGFTCSLHTDGHLATAMQIYWLAPGACYGTGFYQFKDPDTLLYQFESRPNTGYIMLNHANDDGSQPLLWHAMLNPVPEGTVRVSSYWYFV
jgi:hypothetical protein